MNIYRENALVPQREIGNDILVVILTLSILPFFAYGLYFLAVDIMAAFSP